MVLWIKKYKNLWICFSVSLCIALLFTYPYLTKDLLPVEHDTFFHLSRIEGLAKSISNGIWIPSIYPDKNNGFGYASPLFYCDLFMIPYALLYLFGIPLSICYKTMIFVCTMFAAFTIMHLIQHLFQRMDVSIIIAIAYTFSNYHVTDVYVRGAVGEVMAMIFMPVLLEGLYRLFYQKDSSHYYILTIGITGLLLSHNLTFAMSVVLCIIFFLINLRRITKDIFLTTCKAVLFAFFLTVFFTLPMLEQLQDNTYYLNYYGSSSNLAVGSLPVWKYFANTTIFGYSNNTLDKDKQMLLNVGYFLQFVPLLILFTPKKNRSKQPFILHSMIIGYVCLLLPIQYVPWDYLVFLRILQFPWRLLQIAMVLLCIPAAFVLDTLVTNKRKFMIPVLCIILCTEGMYHVLPVSKRTFGLPSTMTWEEVTNGSLTNPYYSATYMRVELAGGDYLPINSIDYRTIDHTIMDNTFTTIDIPFTEDNLSLTFEISDSDINQMIILPKTYWKGYKIYYYDQDTKTEITDIHVLQGLIAFEPKQSGKYVLVYENTPIKKISMTLSCITLILFVLQKKIPFLRS